MKTMKWFIVAALMIGGQANAQTVANNDSLNLLKKTGACEEAYQRGMRVTPSGQFLSYYDWHSLPDYTSVLPDFLEVKKAFSAKNINVILLILPLKGMVPEASGLADFNPSELRQKDYQNTLNNFRKQGYVVPDVLQGIEKFDKSKPFFIPLDHHLTSYAGEFISDSLAKTIMGLPIYGSLNKSEFLTKDLGKVKRVWQQSSRSGEVNSICNNKVNFPDFYMNQYETTKKNESLLADNSAPQIISVGTSQSLPERNIMGFTAEKTKIDIQNSEYIDGAGAYLSMQKYLLSKNYKENPPKLLIWEFSLEEIAITRDDGIAFNDKNIFKQIIPEIYGDCQGDYAQYRNNIGKITDSNFSKSYVVIQNPDVRRTQLIMNYIDNAGNYQTDSVTVNNRINREKIFMAIPKNIKPGTSIELLLNGSNVGFGAKVCHYK